MQEEKQKPSHTPSIIDQLSRTKTKEEIAEQKKAKAQGLDKVKTNDSAAATTETAATTTTNAEAPRGRDPSESAATASTKPNKPRHPDDDRPSMALAPKCTYSTPVGTGID